MRYRIEGNKGWKVFDLYPLALGFAVGVTAFVAAFAVLIHFI